MYGPRPGSGLPSPLDGGPSGPPADPPHGGIDHGCTQPFTSVTEANESAGRNVSRDHADSAPDVTGVWHQDEATAPECARAYPATIRFEGGRFSASRGPGQGFVRWDVGSYRIDGDGIVLSTATDELVRYSFDLSNGVLTVLDADGCRIMFRRSATAPPTGPPD